MHRLGIVPQRLLRKPFRAVSAHYNSSPFAGTVVFAAFYLTQEQPDDFLKNEAACVIVVPEKD
jgi:hypothetical protein